MQTHIIIPDIGDFSDVEVIDVLMKKGQTVHKDEAVILLETDKATLEIPAGYDGVITDVAVAVGDKVSQGHVIGAMACSEAGAPQAPVSPEKTPSIALQTSTASSVQSRDQPRSSGAALGGSAGPAVRKLAHQLGIDLSAVRGTGMRGRILLEDMAAYIKPQMSAKGSMPHLDEPSIAYGSFGTVQNVPLSRIKIKTAENLHAQWLRIPHVTHTDSADIEELEALRLQHKAAFEAKGGRLTPLVFILKAAVAALKAHPEFNAALSPDKKALVLKAYYHLGVAVDTPEGLVVPVIRDVDQKSSLQLAQELVQLSQAARDGTLKAAQMQGSSFTLSSLGGIGGEHFTPIINPGNAAILGICKHQIRPVWQDEHWVPRKFLPLCLSYDHRIIDGAQAARFMRTFCQWLEDAKNMILDEE